MNVSKNQVVWPKCHFTGLASGMDCTVQSSGDSGRDVTPSLAKVAPSSAECRPAFIASLSRRTISGAVRPLDQVEKEYILAALELNGGNQTHTAEQLHIGSATLYRKLKSYGMTNKKRALPS